MIFAGADWVKRDLGVTDISEHGANVANILGQVWRGIYHLPMDVLRKVKWNDPGFIEINLFHDLATYDFSELTELVILCHDLAIRLSIRHCNTRYVKLYFHRRVRESDHMSLRHPTIEQAIENCRRIWNQEAAEK